MADLRYKWDSYCRLTCAKGVDRGECGCERAEECEMQHHVDFKAEYSRAGSRVIRLSVLYAQPNGEAYRKRAELYRLMGRALDLVEGNADPEDEE